MDKPFYSLQINKIFLIFFLFLLIALINFFNSLNNFFTTDDYFFLNPLSISNIRTYFSTDFVGIYRPIPLTVFSLQYAIFGLNPFGYHLLSILLHSINATLVFIVLSKLWKEYFLSAIAAIIFLSLPAHNEAINWISCQFDLIMTTFLLLTFLAFLKKNNFIWLLFSLVFFQLALFSKSIAVVAPLFLIFLQGAGDNREEMGRVDFKKLLFTHLPFWLLAGFHIFYKTIILKMIEVYGSKAHFSISIQLFKNLLINWKKSAFPIEVSLKASLLSFLLFSFIALISRRFRLGFLWYIFFLLPTLNILGWRYLYFPNIGFAIMLANLLVYLNKVFKRQRGFSYAVISVIVLFLLGFYINENHRLNRHWEVAGLVNKKVIEVIESRFPSIPQESAFYFFNLPATYNTALIYCDNPYVLPRQIRAVLNRPDLICVQVVPFEPLFFYANRFPKNHYLFFWDSDAFNLIERPEILSRFEQAYFELNAGQQKYENTGWTFNINGDLEGWIPAQQIENLIIEDGFLSFSCGGNDPILINEILEINPFIFNKFEVRMKIEGEQETSYCQLFFKDKGDLLWSSEKSVAVKVFADGKFHLYQLPISGNPEWLKMEKVESIRFDPVAIPAKVVIDYIKPVANYWTLNLCSD